jgi:multiple sugar transport system permease protein
MGKKEKIFKKARWNIRENITRILNPRFVKTMAWKIIRLVMIIGLCYIILYPFIIKILNSVKSLSDFMDPTVRFISKSPTFDNIVKCFNSMQYIEAFRNTFTQSLMVGIMQMIMCALIGYGLARFDFRGKKIVFACVILTLIIPPQTIMIPLFTRFRFFMGLPKGLIDTFWPMAILSATGLGLKNGLYIFICRQFFGNVPKELEEAASIDGCGSFATFTRIMIPSAVPTLVTVFLFAFSWQWTDLFYNQLFFRNLPTLVNAIDKVTVDVSEPIMYSMMRNTAAMLAILPLALLFIVAQRKFVQSIENSGIVG